MRRTAGSNNRRTYCHIVQYSMQLSRSPRVFRAHGAENLNSRRTELAYCQSLCGYYILSVRKKQVLTERGRKDIIRKEKQALSPPRVSGRRCGPLFDPKSPARAESPQRRESLCCGNPCAAGSAHTMGIPARRKSPRAARIPRAAAPLCGEPPHTSGIPARRNSHPRAARISHAVGITTKRLEQT